MSEPFKPLAKGDEYTCAQCGETFDAGRDQSEDDAEFAETFGVDRKDRPAEQLTVICDDCWQELQAGWRKGIGPVPPGFKS